MIKDILIVVGLAGVAYILFGSKSPSPIFTNPKIKIPNKVSEIANQVSTEIGSTVGTVNIPSATTVHNSAGKEDDYVESNNIYHVKEFFKIN